jgi:uncharacterized protein (DUF362 family)
VDASYGATTHPEVVAGILEYLQEQGFENLVMMEGSWVGDKTEEAYEVCGYRSLSETYGVPFLDMQKEKGVPVTVDDLTFQVCEAALSVDFLINVPVLKGHCQTKLTCALKNMKGLLPNTEKRHFHAMGLHRPIACLSRAIRQDFILIDNICGDLDFEDGGNPVVMNRLIAGRDPVLMDAYACRMLGYEIGEVPYLSMAAQQGIGSADLDGAEILAFGETSDQTPKREKKLVDIADHVQEVESCSACYAYLVPVMEQLKEEGLLENLKTKICIGQGYRGQSGELGIGSCTSRFTHHLKGCPPLEQDMYAFLKKFILS